MKKFVFSMEKILNLREFEQKQAEAELGKANAEVARINSQLEEIARLKIAANKSVAGSGDINLIYANSNYSILLNQKKDFLLEELTKAKMIADEKKALVLEAMKKVKVLQNLKDKKLSEWKKANEKEYENEVDDIVNAKYKSTE